MRKYFKSILILPLIILTACSTNKATGRSQFTTLMSENQEVQIGAQEHKKILAQYGGEVKDQKLKDYLNKIGNKIVPHTERKDVNYTFTLLDSPVVNAFALPGGYVYITRGILTLANDESEVAAVTAHEIGHVTARHSAERYSASVVTSLGASLLSAALKVDGASQALGLGANLYLSSYSRSQEHEADDLGIRYLSRAGYDTNAMARFLQSLEASSNFDALEAGKKKNNAPNYFSTHPVTADRIKQSLHVATTYPKNAKHKNRINHLKAISGMTIGDSADQGFVDNNKFVHPKLGFLFNIPDNYRTQNSAKQVVAKSKNKNGGSLVFTGGKKKKDQSIKDFLVHNVLKGDTSTARDLGTNTINGIKIASVERPLSMNGITANVRTIAYQWNDEDVYLLSLIMPKSIPSGEIQSLQNTAFSFKRMTASDKKRFRPKKLTMRVAKSGDTVSKLASKFPYNDGLNEQRFRTINGLKEGEDLIANAAYKVIVQ